jgi:hypothetical protein
MPTFIAASPWSGAGCAKKAAQTKDKAIRDIKVFIESPPLG